MRVVLAAVGGLQILPAGVAEERHDHQPGHVEGGQAGTEQGGSAEHGARGAAGGEGRLDDRILREVAGEEREADQRQVSGRHGDEGDRHLAGQATEVPHVDVVVHAVHHRTGAEEQAGLEEAVGHQVHDAQRVHAWPQADGQEHVADLRDRRVGQDFLDVVLGATGDTADQQGDRADDGHDQPPVRTQVEDRRLRAIR